MTGGRVSTGYRLPVHGAVSAMPTQPPKLLDRFRSACRRRGDSRPAVHENSSWMPRFVRFHGTP
jgi:hypothetical protein